MEEYSKAEQYADACLQLNHQLLDYTTIDLTNMFAFPRFDINSAVFFYNEVGGTSALSYLNAIVDTTLYDSYDGNDLRKSAFFELFNGEQRYMGSYGQNGALFNGMAVDELYLIRAECLDD